MKNTISQVENSLDEINSRLDPAEDKFSKHEGIAIWNIKSKDKEDRRLKNMPRGSDLWDTI